MTVDSLRPRLAPDPAPALGPPVVVSGPSYLSGSSLAWALRRRWKLCAAAAALGVILATAVSVVVPPDYRATTTLLLRHLNATQIDPTRAMATDVALAKGRPVAQAAVRDGGLRISAGELRRRYVVTSPSDDVMEISTRSRTAAGAVRQAQALGGAVLRFRAEQIQQQSRVVVDALEQRRTALRLELDDLAAQIRTTTPEQGLSGLVTRRTALNDELAEIRRRIDDTSLDATSVVASSRVVGPAALDDRSQGTALAANLATGMVAGLALGVGWVVLRELVSDRVRRREDVEASLGAEVALECRSSRGPVWLQRWRFQRHKTAPTVEVTRLVRHLRRVLDGAGPPQPAVAVVSVDSDGPAGVAVASAAAELVGEGHNVLVVDLSRQAIIAALLEIPPNRTWRHRPDGQTAVLSVTFATEQAHGRSAEQRLAADLEALRAGADVVLALATVDETAAVTCLGDWAATAVAVVTAGRSTTATLRLARRLVRSSRMQLDSAILLGANRWDRMETRSAAPSERPPVRA